jgi:hypothetical protein
MSTVGHAPPHSRNIMFAPGTGWGAIIAPSGISASHSAPHLPGAGAQTPPCHLTLPLPMICNFAFTKFPVTARGCVVGIGFVAVTGVVGVAAIA